MTSTILAHYMTAIPCGEELGAFDRIGGVPSHLPPQVPRSVAFGTDYRFLLQIFSMDKLGLDGWMCVQVYQSAEIDDGDDPLPVPVLIPLDASENHDRLGRRNTASPRKIVWEARQDPDEFPDAAIVTDEMMNLVSSKVGGLPPHEGPSGARFVGQIDEDLGGPGWGADYWGFNFGGRLLTIWEASDGHLFCELT